MSKKVLIYGDFLPTGFGRICRALGLYLQRNGYDVRGACVQWDGLLREVVGNIPFEIAPLNGRDNGQGPAGFARVMSNIIAATKPDVLISVQDFPYHEALRATPIDWSVVGHIAITPVDGVPIADHWAKLVPQFDAFMTISQFGVDAFHAAGMDAYLCPPGADTSEFSRLPDDQRAQLRERLNIPPGAFVAGVMAMNQGRKDFPSMIAGFAQALRHKQDAYLYLDCEPVSPMGWDIPNMLLKRNGIDPAKVRFRGDAVSAGLESLNERYNLLDVHMVLAHREGYGLPHGEAMATGCPSITNDYCSGQEIMGDNERGWLIPAAPPHPAAYGTWGGAVDVWPDMAMLIAALRDAYDKPAERLARGARGHEWVTNDRTWDHASRAVEAQLKRVLADRATVAVAQPAPLLPDVQTHVPTVIKVEHVTVQANDPAQVGEQLIAAIGQGDNGAEPERVMI